jgi:hypothetical protein
MNPTLFNKLRTVAGSGNTAIECEKRKVASKQFEAM